MFCAQIYTKVRFRAIAFRYIFLLPAVVKHMQIVDNKKDKGSFTTALIPRIKNP